MNIKAVIKKGKDKQRMSIILVKISNQFILIIKLMIRLEKLKLEMLYQNYP